MANIYQLLRLSKKSSRTFQEKPIMIANIYPPTQAKEIDLTDTQSDLTPSNKRSREQLVAHWEMVGNKLTCTWLSSES